MKNLSIHDFLLEVSSFHKFDAPTIEKAKASPITTENNPAFRNLVNRWANGDYDNDLEMVVSKIEFLLFST
jgi:hypothetical protein